MFEIARFYAPSTIFFDEIDSIAGERGGSTEHEASRRVKAELLVMMDGASGASSASADLEQGEEEAKKNVMVLAATNRPQDLDEAIRRRLEKRVYIPLPDEVSREHLFKINLKSELVSEDVNYKKLVARTEGYSGADLSNVCRDAAMAPMRKMLDRTGFNIEDLANPANEINKTPLTMEDFEEAIKKNQPSVSKGNLKEFEEWMAEFGSC